MDIVDPHITEWRDRRSGTTFDEWLWKCDRLWDSHAGELATDHSYYPWQEWYERGYTVEFAVELAEEMLFGHRARSWQEYLDAVGLDEDE